MTNDAVNPEMLILARESRGLTQAELSRKVGIGQSVLSKYENGMLDVSIENLNQIALTLGYPVSLFTRREHRLGFGSTCLHHRKWQTIPARDLRQIQAKVNLTRMHIARLLQSAEIESEYEFPRLDIIDYDSASQIADLVRRAWQVPMGPVRDLTTIIERAGGIVVPCHFAGKKLDAISQWPSTMPPLFFINVDMPWERIRFSLAHEIGHLVMHDNPTPDQETEADMFAAAFLMPEQEISTDLSDLTLARAAQLKPYWMVSIQALVRRAYDLGEISQSKYRRLFTQLSRLGYRRNEPDPLRPERPYVLRELIDLHFQYFEYTKSELSQLLDLHEAEFEAEYMRNKAAGPISIVK